jgi:hypothetical protein
MFRPLRITGDLLLLGIGIILLVLFDGFGAEALRSFLPPDQLAWRWLIPSAALPLAWSLTLIFFFGRELIHRVLREKPPIVNLA